MFQKIVIQFDVLIAFLMWDSDPLPLRMMLSLGKTDNINLSVDNASPFESFGLYDFNTQNVNMISDDWIRKINEFYNKGKIYDKFVEENPELANSQEDWFLESGGVRRGYVFDQVWD